MTGALAGKTIINTRATHQAETLNNLLRAKGAVPLDYPCIAITPPEDSATFDAALIDLAAGRFDWLVLTSANTVIAIAERLKALGLKLETDSFRTAVVGPATAEVAQAQLRLEPAHVPTEFVAESLANSLPIEIGARVLLPESAVARPTLAEMLSARGAQVNTVAAYRTVCGHGGADVPHLLAQKQIDALTFTSSSTVTCFLERLRTDGGIQENALTLFVACIGAKTAATARESGFTRIGAPVEHTLEGLIGVLDAYFAYQIESEEQR